MNGLRQSGGLKIWAQEYAGSLGAGATGETCIASWRYGNSRNFAGQTRLIGDAALRDLKRAGLPDEAEAHILSVADVMMAPATSNYEIAEQALTSRRVTAGLMLAQKWDADAIFIGGRRFSSAFERFRLGSVATGLVTKAHCSVEVARNPIN